MSRCRLELVGAGAVPADVLLRPSPWAVGLRTLTGSPAPLPVSGRMRHCRRPDTRYQVGTSAPGRLPRHRTGPSAARADSPPCAAGRPLP